MSERHHNEVRAGYDVIADAYLERVSISRESAGVQKGVRALIEEIKALFPVDGKVVDLGCGAGWPFTAVLAESFDVTGVDFSSRQIELAMANVPHARFVRDDISAIDFPKGSLSAVTAFFSIIHVHRDLHAELFKSIASWLKPGGVFVASLGKRGQEEDWDDNWFGARMFWSYQEPEVALSQITESGMTVERSWHETVEDGIDGPETFFWVLAKKSS